MPPCDTGNLSAEMALYTKQDFSPPVLSKRWIAMKFRPNMILHSHANIIAILESGLLFREDSIEVEQEAPCAEASRDVAGCGGWLTPGERMAGVAAVVACVAAWPPRDLRRSTIIRVTAYMCLPAILRAYHRLSCRGALSNLLSCMRDYIALARRAAACLKECNALRGQLNSVTTITTSLYTLLCRQQASLSSSVARASSALLGNAPWLRGDVAWDAVADTHPEASLMKIHHGFLVIQSTFLKHIAMAHFIPTVHQARKLYKNHNERLYWIHTTLLPHITEEFKENHEALTRMYRLLKNYSTSDVPVKTPGTAIVDNWFYSDVHSGIARASLELKTTLNKCHDLDTFLDACAVNNQDIDLDVLSKDIDDLLDSLTNALKTVQNSQIRLKKIGYKSETREREEEAIVENESDILKIEDNEPESKDEVFYFVNTGEGDLTIQPNVDITTGPGIKEIETTEIVLNELKRKLVKREDVMRERERQALKKTMPELVETPEFPRQLKDDTERKGFIKKIRQSNDKKSEIKRHKIEKKTKPNKYCIERKKYNENGIDKEHYEGWSNVNKNNNIITIDKNKKAIVVTKWLKEVTSAEKPEKAEQFSDLSEGLSDVEAGTANKTVHEAVNSNGVKKNYNYEYKFSKKDMEFTPSSESDSDTCGARNMKILQDVRKHRVTRKKKYPDKRASVPKDDQDEGLKPWRPALGAGLALAAVLRGGHIDPPVEGEAEFIGQGQLSEDSGHSDSD